MQIQGSGFEIQDLGLAQAKEILSVYRRCEDFLALGPAPASMEMVLDDLAHSLSQGGVFCGIYEGGEMSGVFDFMPDHYGGCKGCAFLSLLMIADDCRGRGLGRKAVEAVEAEILKNARITEIRSGVQVNNPAGIAFWRRMGYQIAGGPELMEDTTTVWHLKKVIDRKS